MISDIILLIVGFGIGAIVGARWMHRRMVVQFIADKIVCKMLNARIAKRKNQTAESDPADWWKDQP